MSFGPVRGYGNGNEKSPYLAGYDLLDAACSAQLFPPVTMKNIATKNAIRTMRQMVRNGTFDAKVFLTLLDLGLFSYGSIWCRNCRWASPRKAGSSAFTSLLPCGVMLQSQAGRGRAALLFLARELQMERHSDPGKSHRRQSQKKYTGLG